MEINLARMKEYNNYNYSILQMLEQTAQISVEERERGIKACETLLEIYNSVMAGKSVDGRLTIINDNGV